MTNMISHLSKFALLLLLLFALTEAFSHLLCKSEQYPFVRLTEQERSLLQSLSKELHVDKAACVQESTTLTPAELEEYRLQLRVVDALSPSPEESAYVKVLMDRTGTNTLDQLQEKLGLKERKTFIRRLLEKIGFFREKPSTSALSQLSVESNQATIDLLNRLKVPLAEKSFLAELRERIGCTADATLDDMKTKVDKWLESGKEKLETVKEKTAEGAGAAKEKLGGLKEKTVQGAETVKEKTAEGAGAAKEKLETLKEKTAQGAETVGEKIKGAGEQGIEALKEKSEELKQKAKETYEGAKEKMQSAAETVKEKKDELKEKAGSAAETLKEKAAEGAENIKEKAAEGAETVKETVEKTQQAAAEWLKEKAETIKEGFQRAKDTTEQLKEAGAEKVKNIICEENVHGSPNCPGVAV